MMAVLSYYRAEWTDIAHDDEQHKIVLTEDVRGLIRGCFRGGSPVPNAAKEVELFLNLSSSKHSFEDLDDECGG
jgi:hypothetical protein